MRMLCYKCGHSWNYTRRNTEGEWRYITCPGCYYKIRVDKALIEDFSKQKLLTNLPNKELLPKKLLIKLPTTQKLPTTTKLKIEFETLKDKDGFVYRVDKRMSEQFKETLRNEEIEETLMTDESIEEQEPVIKILPPKFKIIRIIPRDPIKITEHQVAYPRNLG